MRLSNGRAVFLLLGVYVLLAGATLLCCNGTGDAGDSIGHYLFARYAPRHPALFFDHWAKPLFVLFACPFAQLGFTGMKLFNALLFGGTLYLTYRIARELGLPRASLALLILLCAPLCFTLTFSGLTEPFFACALAGGLLLALQGRLAWAAILVSFLPFIRSEGLVLIGVFALYTVLARCYRLLPLLGTSTVLYSIAGAFVHHDLLWTFTRIPYATLHSTYGSGHPLHFAVQWLYVLGVPIYALFLVGGIRFFVELLQRRLRMDRHFLVLGTFLAFVVAHALFWYLGVFNSMGLNRVLLCVAPAAALIALHGLNTLCEGLARWRRNAGSALQWALMAYVVVFPFTPNPAAVDVQHDLMLRPDQRCMNELAAQWRVTPDGPHRFVGAHPYLCMALQVDRFDTTQWLPLDAAHLDRITPNDLVLWDDWFATVEGGVQQRDLEQHGLRAVAHYTAEDHGRVARYTVYRR